MRLFLGLRVTREFGYTKAFGKRFKIGFQGTGSELYQNSSVHITKFVFGLLSVLAFLNLFLARLDVILYGVDFPRITKFGLVVACLEVRKFMNVVWKENFNGNVHSCVPKNPPCREK
jgi:hypothetical protein